MDLLTKADELRIIERNLIFPEDRESDVKKVWEIIREDPDKYYRGRIRLQDVMDNNEDEKRYEGGGKIK